MVIVYLSERAERIHQAIYALYKECVGFPEFGLMSDELHRWAYDRGLISHRELEALLRYENFLCNERFG